MIDLLSKLDPAQIWYVCYGAVIGALVVACVISLFVSLITTLIKRVRNKQPAAKVEPEDLQKKVQDLEKQIRLLKQEINK